MSGQPGRSGGANRIPIEEHVRRGTFRPERHGRRLTLVPDNDPGDPGEPPDRLLTGLGDAGKDFVECCWVSYRGWTPGLLVLLHESGRLLDQLEVLRGQKGERDAQRLLLAVLAQLRLGG